MCRVGSLKSEDPIEYRVDYYVPRGASRSRCPVTCSRTEFIHKSGTKAQRAHPVSHYESSSWMNVVLRSPYARLSSSHRHPVVGGSLSQREKRIPEWMKRPRGPLRDSHGEHSLSQTAHSGPPKPESGTWPKLYTASLTLDRASSPFKKRLRSYFKRRTNSGPLDSQRNIAPPLCPHGFRTR